MSKKTAKELVEGFKQNGGHPKPEIGPLEDEEGYEKTWRFVYMDECKRRGKQLLIDLGWPTEMDSVYVNIHTGCLENLEAQLNHYVLKEDAGWNHVWALVEHWVPYDSSKLNQYLIDYLKRNLQGAELQLEKAKSGKSTHGLSCPAERKEALKKIAECKAELKEEMERVPIKEPI